MTPAKSACRVIVVDDDEAVIRFFGRVLASKGFEVGVARSGAEAKRLLSERSFDVMLSDISMPGMNGIELVEELRTMDVDVPVVLVTGEPELDTAIRAVELGAVRYLRKPVGPDELVSVVSTAARFGQLAQLKREALALSRARESEASNREKRESSFARALDSLRMLYQPIVSLSERRVVAYEAFVRSQMTELGQAPALVAAAEGLDHVHVLGRRVRRSVSETFPKLPAALSIFVNLHPKDIHDEDLFDDDAALSSFAPRVVLELTERARLGPIEELNRRVGRLRAMGYRLAIDDLGSGYSGLNSLVSIHPEFVKIDMLLTRGVHEDPTRQNLIRSMAGVSRELGISMVVEGVETPAERRVLAGLGVDLLQGYLFGEPERSFTGIADHAFD